jgi:hypothetical protein
MFAWVLLSLTLNKYEMLRGAQHDKYSLVPKLRLGDAHWPPSSSLAINLPPQIDGDFAKQELCAQAGSQAGRAVAQIGLGLVFFMAKIILRSGKKLNKCW